MMTWNQMGLQDANSGIMEEFVYFHDHVMITLVGILGLVSVTLMSALMNSHLYLQFSESQALESIWTLVPALILIQIAIPSLALLYMFDEVTNSALIVKTIGHQWYWSYEYSDFVVDSKILEFDSFMVESTPRLLDVDNAMALPVNMSSRLLVGSADVLHAWAVPSFGVKADACPGRLNQLSLVPLRTGTFFGQCSEICGANHSFMPIRVEVGSIEDFINWFLIEENE